MCVFFCKFMLVKALALGSPHPGQVNERWIRKRPRAWLHAAALSLLAYSASSVAAPFVFEESALILNPDTSWHFPRQVAIDGDTLIATAQRDIPGEGEEETFVIQVAWLFERQSDGRWDFVRTLVEDTHVRRREDPRPMTVAIRDGRAAIHTGRVWVFERTANGWVEQPSDARGGDGDVAVGGNAIVASYDACSYDTNAFTRNSLGVWTLAGTTDGLDTGCDTEADLGTDVDMSPSDHFIVAQPDEAHLYERTSTGWTQAAILRDPIRRFGFGDEVAMDDEYAFVSSITPTPIQVFGRQPGGWMHRSAIAPPESALLFSPQVMKLRNVLAAGFHRDGYRGGSVGLFRRNSEGGYDHVARLVTRDGIVDNFFPQAVDVWTNGSVVRVAGASADRIYVFEVNQLGQTPAPLQETFESGNAAQWSTLAGSSFAVVSSGGSNVYRQSYFDGDAAAYLTNIDWTNQAIEADVRPTAFNGFDRWAGLIVRRTDARNYYYLTLRSSNSLQIRRMLNGQFGRLASAQLTVSPNRTYRLRLEAVGTRLRAFVNGRLATEVEVDDQTLTHGHVGLMTSKARADFDNIVVSQNPHLQLINPEIAFLSEYRWSFGPGTWRPLGDYVDPVAQTSTSGDARAVTLVDAQDQAIQVRAQATAFASGTGSKWFGVMARYVDERNYYYVTLRNSNEISLRKLVNGTIYVLDTAPLTVTPGTWYTVGLEAIGDQLRARVNGSVRVEATDSTHAQGRYGLVSYKTAAQYQEFIAYQP